MAIREEQAAFEAVLDKLVGDPTTVGKYVLIFGGKVEGAFDSRGDGYAAGLKRFGTSAEFLVARAQKNEPPINISVAWDLGLVRVEQT